MIKKGDKVKYLDSWQPGKYIEGIVGQDPYFYGTIGRTVTTIKGRNGIIAVVALSLVEVKNEPTG